MQKLDVIQQSENNKLVNDSPIDENQEEPEIEQVEEHQN